MAEEQPQDQSQPNPPQDWNEVSAREIEKTISDAADLAYELAGDIGGGPARPGFRDTSGLESIETALDVELKQLEHLVGRTKEELDGTPRAKVDQPKRGQSIPDFMSEFLSDDPVTIVPEPRPDVQTSARESESSPAGAGGGIDSGGAGTMTHGAAATTKAGLIGVGTLGERPIQKKTRTEKVDPRESNPPPKSGLRESLSSAAFRACQGGVRILEVADLPFGKLAPSTKRALSVTAIAAFSVCLALYVLSLLFS